MNRRRPPLCDAELRHPIPMGDGGDHGTLPLQAPAAGGGPSAGSAPARAPCRSRAETVAAGRRIAAAPSGGEAEG